MHYSDYYSDIKYVFRAGAKEKTPFSPMILKGFPLNIKSQAVLPNHLCGLR